MRKADICGHCIRAEENFGRNGNVKCSFLGILKGYNEKACDMGWMIDVDRIVEEQVYKATFGRLPTDYEKYGKKDT